MSSDDPHSDSKAREHKSKKKNGSETTSRVSGPSLSSKGKTKKKRTRSKLDANKLGSQDQNWDPDMEMLPAEQSLELGMLSSIDDWEDSKEKLEVTAIQLTSSKGGDNDNRDSTGLQRISRAEERRREIERKRAEKRELERRRKEEEERKVKLQVCMFVVYVVAVSYREINVYWVCECGS